MEKKDANARGAAAPGRETTSNDKTSEKAGTTNPTRGPQAIDKPAPATTTGKPNPPPARPTPASGNGEAPRRAVPESGTDSFLDERDDVLAVINELEDQIDRYQEIRERLERELRETTEQLHASNQRGQELEWQLVSMQTRVDALEQTRHEVSTLEEELSDANGRIARLTEQLTRSEKDNAHHKNELRSANKQLEELWAVRKERDGLRVDMKTAGARLEELERAHREAIDEKLALQTRLQDTTIQLDEARAARHEIELGQRAAQERARELEQAQAILNDKLEAARVEKKNLLAQLTHLERENARLLEQQRFYECEVTSLRNASRNAETALASVKKAFAEVRVALGETKSRARRRATESWPRIGASLRTGEGPSESEGLDGELDAIALDAASLPTGTLRNITPSKFTSEFDAADVGAARGH